jgi:hypothetical protein
MLREAIGIAQPDSHYFDASGVRSGLLAFDPVEEKSKKYTLNLATSSRSSLFFDAEQPELCNTHAPYLSSTTPFLPTIMNHEQTIFSPTSPRPANE